MSRGFAWILASGLAFSAIPATAAELHFDLLDGLRQKGYGDMAVLLLKNMEQGQKIPDDLKETFDLELARSLQVAAQYSENIDEAEKLRLETRTQLDKFIKEHPTHDEAAYAYDTYGILSLGIGNSALRQAAVQKDPARKSALIAQAKTAFEEARPRFDQAAKLFQAKYEKIKQEQSAEQPTRTKKPTKRLVNELYAAENDWVNSRFELAMIDFHMARTYPDMKSKEAKDLLLKAEKALDAIWYGYNNEPPGLPAHHWTARINEELGNNEKAIDIYDEVTANEPEEGNDVSPDRLRFFGENFLYRTRLQAKIGKIDDMLLEAEDWLDRNSQRKTDPYFGIMLEVAKAYIAKAEALKDEDEKKKIMTKVIRTLRDVRTINNSYQSEILLLLRKYSASAGEAPTEAGTFDEAVALAEAAADAEDYSESAKLFSRAMELKDQEKNAERLDQVEFSLAVMQYQSGDYASAQASAEKFSREKKAAKQAPGASVLALNAAAAQYGSAPDKAAAEQHINDLAEYTIQTWPNRAEADDARIALGRLKMSLGDLPAAITALQKVNSASDRYAQTLNLIGQCHWRSYLIAKRSGKLDDAAKAHRAEAQKNLDQALAFAAKSTAASDEAVVAETRLFLGELHLEGGAPDQSIAMLTPLESKIRDSKPESLDNSQFRALAALIGAHVAQKNMASAKATADLVLQHGSDSPPVNAVLSSVARQLREGVKSNQARVIEAEANSTVDATLKESVDQSKSTLSDFLTKFSTRQQLGLPELIAIGDGASEAGNKDLAKATYQRVLDAGNAAPQKTPQVELALISVKSSFVGLLRADKEYEKAMTQVDELIQSAPKALDPKVERARILQGIAEQSETNLEQWAAAAKAWGDLRVAFARSTKKPPAYYEMVYNTAACLHGQARSSTQEAQAAEFKKQALALLKGTIALAPKLSGPDMVARYQTLIEAMKE